MYANHLRYKPQYDQYQLLPSEELERRYNKIRTFTIEKLPKGTFHDPEEVPWCGFAHETKKASLDDAYMWEPEKIGYLGKTFSNDQDIHSCVDGTNNITQEFETRPFLTIHSYNCSVFFKPRLREVLSQLPAALFDDFNELFVATLLNQNWNHSSFSVIGKHLGLTIVAVRKN